MKVTFPLLILLGPSIITNGAPVTSHPLVKAVKREPGCQAEFQECKNNKPESECEKEAMECYFSEFGTEETLIIIERFCNLPAVEEGTDKRSSSIKRTVDCFELFKECRNEHPEEEEVPHNILTECHSDYLTCLAENHIDSYQELLNGGREVCKQYREEAEAEVPEKPCETMKDVCLHLAEDNVIGDAECDEAYVNCKLKEAE